MRLTNNKYLKKTGNYFISDIEQFNANQKLGQLEDIEDELGIDLITLLYKHPYAKHLLYNLIHNIPFVFAPKKEEQGKTWSLTKEELEKGD